MPVLPLQYPVLRDIRHASRMIETPVASFDVTLHTHHRHRRRRRRRVTFGAPAEQLLTDIRVDRSVEVNKFVSEFVVDFDWGRNVESRHFACGEQKFRSPTISS